MLGPFVNTKVFPEVWLYRKSWYKHSFQAYVESLMEKGLDTNLEQTYDKEHEVENAS